MLMLSLVLQWTPILLHRSSESGPLRRAHGSLNKLKEHWRALSDGDAVYAMYSESMVETLVAQAEALLSKWFSGGRSS